MVQNKFKKLAILGVTHNTDNYGVRVLLSSAVEALSINFKDKEIVILDYGYKSEVWSESTSIGKRLIRLINLRFSWKLFLANNVFTLIILILISRLVVIQKWRNTILCRNLYIREILNINHFYSISGGDSFSDVYGFRRFLYVTLPQVLVILLKKPITLLPQTYGPYTGKIAKYIAKWIFKRVHAVYSRDTEGISVIKDLMGSFKIDVKVKYDLGYILVPEPLSSNISLELKTISDHGPIIGLNVSSLLYIGGYTRNNMFNLLESYDIMIDTIVQYLMSSFSCQLLLIPHVYGGASSKEDETELCRKLHQKYIEKYGNSVNYIDRKLNHNQIKSVIGSCDLFIGARMHACIAAVSQSVPCICLAYSDKFKGVMRPFGIGAKVLDLRMVKTQEIVSNIRYAFLNRIYIKKSLLNINEMIKNDLHTNILMANE